MISTIYWGLLLLFPTLILRPQDASELNPAVSSEASDDLLRVPLYLDLALHAVPGSVLLLDFFLFERKYPKTYARYGGAAVAVIAGGWYSWWVEYCASYNKGLCEYCSRVLTVCLLMPYDQSHIRS